MGFFNEKNGSKSMMRLLAFMGFVAGTGVMIAGVIAMFMTVAGAGTAIIIGGGLAGGGQALKSLQKKFEV